MSKEQLKQEIEKIEINLNQYKTQLHNKTMEFLELQNEMDNLRKNIKFCNERINNLHKISKND